jgi:glycerol kinase
MAETYVLALDQGTTSSRAILFDRGANPVRSAAQEFQQIYPQPGWVEHDPAEIWNSQRLVAERVLAESGVRPGQVAAIGITNQRETTILWEKSTGNPVHNAIVWQCRRTSPLCLELERSGFGEEIRKRTGLVCDAYFSGTKVRWLLDNVPGLRRRAERGEILFGTVDSWLLYNLTGGQTHATDVSNASRTMLYNIHERRWDPVILDGLEIPPEILPTVCSCSRDFGGTARGLFSGVGIPIAGMAGDQQAALFGQACFHPGMVKVTYGTGAFLLMNTGARAIRSENGLLTTIAWDVGGTLSYALEGSVFIAGAAIQWLRDGLGLLSSSAESESLARGVPDNGGVYFVPAMVGLGAPYWDGDARGLIIGLSRGTSRAHLARAALEAMAYQVKDVLECMEADAALRIPELRADGGAAQNSWLLQFQADILGTPVLKPANVETTALGAAALAGLGVGYWRDLAEIESNWNQGRRHTPEMNPQETERLCRDWRRAVERARKWASA